MKHLLCLCLILIAGGSPLLAKSRMVLSCSPDNDLFRILKKSGVSCLRTDSAEAAMQKASPGGAVLILADSYPKNFTPLTASNLELASQKRLRMFVEYPDTNAFPELRFGPIRSAEWERGVIASDVFGSSLPAMRLVAVHNCQFLPVTVSEPWLVIARVAGFDKAVYGIPKTAWAGLFALPDRNVLLATTKLSDFITARYAPSKDWATIWERILAELDPEAAPFHLSWESSVRPAFGSDERLPRNFEGKAFNATARWILDSRLLVPSSRTNEIVSLLRNNKETVTVPDRKDRSANGSLGILEGYASGIGPDGSQLQRLPLRADCHAESSMVLALHARLSRDRSSAAVAGNLLDFVYFKSGMCAGPRADERHGAFGLIGWGDVSPAWLVANYGDDNARAILGTITAAASLNNSKWNGVITKALLANYRTTGKLGFRGDRIDNPSLANGWKQYFNGEPINYAPHFESYLWACNLWAFRATGYQPFFNRATNAIAMTMKVYPGGWRWQDNNERSRMLLCLSWLVRLEDTAEHRNWLLKVADDLLKRQETNGAIHEWLGGTGGGHYQIPQSNEAYGTGETPLIQANGDPASDQLYTTGFALLGLHEAAGATGDIKLKQAEDKLAEFLCRIQVRSKTKPYLNGWWFRAFDDRRWEYWASSADIGWGAWSQEAGWAQAWTAATLALREQRTTLWDFTKSVSITNEFEMWKPKMLE